MPHYKFAAPFILVSILSYCGWRAEESAPAAIIAVLALAVGLAILYRPGFARSVLSGDIPDLRDIGLLAMSAVTAYIMVGFVDWFFHPEPSSGYAPRERLAEQIVWWLYLVTGGIALLPFIGQIVRNHRNPARTVAQWPAALGPAAALLIGVAIVIVWVTLGKWAVTKAPAEPAALVSAIAVLGLAAMVAGIGVPLWLRAMTAGDAARFDASGIFGQAMQAMAVGIALGMVLAASVMFAPDRLVYATSLVDGAALSVMIGGAWLVVLWRIRGNEPVSASRAVAAVALIIFSFPLSLMPPAWVLGARDWAPLALLVMAPLSVGVAVLVLTLMPGLLRRALGAASGNPRRTANAQG